MILTYTHNKGVHVFKLSGVLETQDQLHLNMMVDRHLVPEPGKVIHLTLDCSDLKDEHGGIRSSS